MNTKLIIFNVLFLLTNLCQGHIYTRCDNYIQLDQCIDNPFCQWCNISNKTNITYITYSSICKPNTECVYNNSECISNNKLNELCNLLDIFISLSLIFMLFGAMFYVSYFTKNLVDKYFDIPIDNGEAIIKRGKEKVMILLIVNILLFIPPIIFWIIGSMAFIYYSIFLMGLVLILTCSTTTTKYYNKNKHKQKSAYTQIN